MIPGKSVMLGSWHCPGCGFDWVSGDALAAFLPTVRAFENLRAKAASGQPSLRSLRCPLCSAESLREVKVAGVHIDVCPKCVSVALDPGEMRALKSLVHSKAQRAVDVLSGVDALTQILTLFC